MVINELQKAVSYVQVELSCVAELKKHCWISIH